MSECDGSQCYLDLSILKFIGYVFRFHGSAIDDTQCIQNCLQTYPFAVSATLFGITSVLKNVVAPAVLCISSRLTTLQSSSSPQAFRALFAGESTARLWVLYTRSLISFLALNHTLLEENLSAYLDYLQRKYNHCRLHVIGLFGAFNPSRKTMDSGISRHTRFQAYRKPCHNPGSEHHQYTRTRVDS